MPDSTGNMVFDSAVIDAENAQDTAEGAAAATAYGALGYVTPANSAAYAAALRAADIAYLKAIVASGLANGISTENARAGLRALGAL